MEAILKFRSIPLWKATRKWLWLVALLPAVLPLIGLGLLPALGSAAYWAGPFIVLVMIPLWDWLGGVDILNPDEGAVAQLEKQRFYRRAVFAAVGLEWVSFIAAVYTVGTVELGAWEYLGLALTLGCTTGISINTAHELGHKNGRLEQWMARLALAPVAYGHFIVEHNRGHHVRVSTPEDPASSRYGETFWEFWPRTVFGSLKSAWHLEKERLNKRGLSVWHWRNENLIALALTSALFGAALAFVGAKLIPFLIIQTVFGFSLLEVVNYIEHYGLKRQKKEDGRYEKVKPEHSWNSNRLVTNLFLYQLQRHSDHHANPSRSYQSLRHFDDVPQLPMGYATMMAVAWCSPLWFKIMNPKVERHYRGDLSKANVQPR